MHTPYTLSKELSENLARFFRYNDMPLLKESLRRQFIDYLDYELNSGLIPLYFNDFLYAFNSLLDIMDEAGKEIQEFELEKHQQPLINAKEKVITFIKTCINPEKIFLLHHHVKDEHEHFDMLVIISSTANTSFNHYEQVISMANMENITIDVSLHKSEAIQQQLTEGHLYYNMACHTERLIYGNALPAFSYPSKEMLQTTVANAEKQFMQAYGKAGGFLEGAANFYGEHNRQMTAFMLQQAVELTARGVVTALLGNCAKTHSFKDLKKPLHRCLPELQYLLSENEEEENRLLHILEKAYLESRYSNELSIPDNDLDKLVEASEVFYERAKDLFDAKLKVLLG